MSAELNKLVAKRPSGLPWAEGFVAPAYDGRSLINLAAAVLFGFGIEPPTPVLAIPEVASELRSARKVVLFLVDALGYEFFTAYLEATPDSVWHELTDEVHPITSVFPSTTVAALTSLWTARSPLEHGLIAYELLLKDLGLTAKMIELTPSVSREPEWLIKAGLIKPEEFMPLPLLSQLLTEAGVEVYGLMYKPYWRSGLTQLHLRGVKPLGYFTLTDLMITLRDFLNTQTDGPFYLWVYWPGLDTLGHMYGVDLVRLRAEFEEIGRLLRNLVLRGLTGPARAGLMVLVTGDHGMVSTPEEAILTARSEPELMRPLVFLPTGEGRAAFLYVRSGTEAEVQRYFAGRYPDRFVIWPGREAIRAGLFGPGEPPEYTWDRVGDLIVVARGNNALYWGVTPNQLLGRHGGVEFAEMVVPLIRLRL